MDFVPAANNDDAGNLIGEGTEGKNFRDYDRWTSVEESKIRPYLKC